MVAEESWREEILSTLTGAGDVDVKALRKMVLVARQLDEKDKDGKKTFKKTVKALEEERVLKVSSDGQIKLLSKKRKNKEDGSGDSAKKNTKSSEKKAKKSPVKAEIEDNYTKEEEQVSNEPSNTENNPDGITRLFVGNLPFKVDEDSLAAFLPGVTHIKWITDKETGKFYGSSFVEMENANSAGLAVAKSGDSLMGRPIKVNFAPPRSGEVWPPTKKSVKGNEQTKRPAGGVGIHAMSKKPDDCHKLFVGNLSYDVDDDVITKFFAAVNAEVKAIRWIHHKDTGFFKGVYVDFVHLNGNSRVLQWFH